MHDEDILGDRVRRFEAVERDVLYHLTTPEDGQPLWSVGDLNREMEREDVIDYLNGLHRAGLIHRTSDGYVFATRAAVRMVAMVGRVI
jgi:hypothetical protein